MRLSSVEGFVSQVLDLIRELSDASGVSGHEYEVKGLIKRSLSEVAEVESDGLGSLVARLKGGVDRPRVMIASHMDEIGFMVSHITKEGFIYFRELGGWTDHVLLAQRVTIKTRLGDVVGVIGSKPPHIMEPDERNKLIKSKDMFIDIGAESEAQVLEMGVRPGDAIVPCAPFTEMARDGMIMGKAFDDRLGCAVMVEAMRRLASRKLGCSVYGVGTVQEEVGLRGARTSSSAVDPDIGIASEVAMAGDTPGIREIELKSKVGKGPVVIIFDRSLIPNPRLRDFVADTAESEGIPYQFQASAGGTDAGNMSLHGTGVPSLVIGVPTRYIHSHVGVASMEDVENTIKLLVAVIENLDAEAVEKIRG